LGAEDFDYEDKIPAEQHKDPANVAAGLKGYVQPVAREVSSSP
jgi:hypothetical protein